MSETRGGPVHWAAGPAAWLVSDQDMPALPPLPVLLEPRRIVITDGVLQLQRCTLYAHTSPILNDHHVCPESWWAHAGKPDSSPHRLLCPACHMTTHACIDGLIRGYSLALMPPRCIALAQQALSIAQSYGLSPAPTL